MCKPRELSSVNLSFPFFSISVAHILPLARPALLPLHPDQCSHPEDSKITLQFSFSMLACDNRANLWKTVQNQHNGSRPSLQHPTLAVYHIQTWGHAESESHLDWHAMQISNWNISWCMSCFCNGHADLFYSSSRWKLRGGFYSQTYDLVWISPFCRWAEQFK